MEYKRILVPIDGSKMDKDVIQLACRLARRSKGKVYVTYVIQLERTLPLDANAKPQIDRGEDVLDRAEQCAEECDYPLSTDLLQARAVGPALVNEASERGADLIIIGINYKMRFGEFSLGDIVPYILKHATCRIILFREPIPVK